MDDPLRRAAYAPDPRTLVDIFRATAEQAGDDAAIDIGSSVLTYAELEEAADGVAAELNAAGIGRGAKVGVRITSGTTELYTAIIGILLAGAAYVPVDADDPDERARVVFGEAEAAAVIRDDLEIEFLRRGEPVEPVEPSPSDDAWVIFTSGSTGKPKGVAVTHRNAAAFVDAESRMFLQEEPIGVGDRVMAGLSVAFDASCEEMWLAWRYGACLVPAPRALVRSGVDVGPWLIANRISIVSTVPTLVSLWPEASLAKVRLIITGGEAIPGELAARLQAPGREVWNTYGPTEATVVACGALLTGEGPVRIGLPLDGWDLAVVDPATGIPVAEGATGELIIGGVGLARYLDPEKDAEKYASMPTLGWDRAYRSGDLVINDPAGLLFGGRADDQIKLGGRRIELGEIDSALLQLQGVQGAAAAIRKTVAGNRILVGYLSVDDTYDAAEALAQLRTDLPAALVPRLAIVDTLPTRTSGKVDRDALPWPLKATSGPAGLNDTEAWIASLWHDILGADVAGPKDDFFDHGGGSLTAAQIVGRLRERYPEIAMGDLYEQPTLGALAAYAESLGASTSVLDREVPAVPIKTQVGQVIATFLLRCLAAPRWFAWIALALAVVRIPDVPHPAWWSVLPLALVFLTPPGRMIVAATVARWTLRGIKPGDYPRGGKVHLRVWFATRAVEELGALNLSGAPWVTWYARLLGCKIGDNADLHSLPPVTGFLKVGAGASIEPEVDLAGHWIDGDVFHLGRIEIGADARVGARSMLNPGAKIGENAEVAPGSAVFGKVPAGESWSGSPAARVHKSARGPWQERIPRSRAWILAYTLVAAIIGLLPAMSMGLAAWIGLELIGRDHATRWQPWLAWSPLLVLIGAIDLAVSIIVIVRICGLLIRPGIHPVRSARGLAIWTTIRTLDEARTWLFPLYSSTLTPVWLRILGAKIGKDVEASTVLMIPGLTQVNDEAFLADDTLIGGYELGGGWVRVEKVKVGKRAFVGNSGMAAPGRKVPKASLVAVLSAAPARKKAHSGESWLGSPPTSLRRAVAEDTSGRTYRPTPRLRLFRFILEVLRVVPLTLSYVLPGTVVYAVVRIGTTYTWALALVSLGPLLVLAGLGAAVVTTIAKWLLCGRMKPGTHPLWSSFVWRNELADTFVETMAAPWFARSVAGTPLLTWWFRSMGASIGKGVWVETHWLPETDLVILQDGATVNAGTVVQTHLFHDRMLQLDTVTLRRGATLGPNSVILPAATLGRHATVGPVSLVMRGESVPDKTAWIGNPIGPWEMQGVSDADG